MSAQGSAYGQFQPEDAGSDFSKVNFLIERRLARVRTMVPVTVISCTNSGGISPVGFVNVQPTVNMTDGAGNATQHGIINNVPYQRIQGGTSAIIIDPVAGDLGWCGICDRDISSLKNNKAISNPGSWRRFDLADAVYIASGLNGPPTQYVQFSSTGIMLKDINGNTITMGSSGITINGILFPPSGSGNWATHMHSGVTTGSGDTGPPV